MSFAKFSNEYILDGSTSIENIYISEYLPSMPEIINKVYIYGLYLCQAADNPDNALQAMSSRLGVSELSLHDFYTYLEQQGLVQILKKNPFEVRYLPIKNASHIRKFSPTKYADFNLKLEEMLSERPITVNEYNEYYNTIEHYHFEPEAFLLIVNYAITQKDKTIGYPYILAIARNWAAEGATTLSAIEHKISSMQVVSSDLIVVFRTLSLKRNPDFEDKQMYIKWTKGFEYDLNIILNVAKSIKKGGMEKLHSKLCKYYESKLLTLADIKNYEKNIETLYQTAKIVNKKLGLYYEQLDNIIDTYIAPWVSYGYDEDSLSTIADYCFKRNIRTLDGFNEQVEKFYKLGLISASTIYNHFERISSADALIKEVLTAANLDIAVTSRTRDFYRTWTFAWGLSHDIVIHAATLSSHVAQPIPYMNKILSEWHAKGYKSKEEIPKQMAQTSNSKTNKSAIVTREYTKEQLDSLIDNIDDIEF